MSTRQHKVEELLKVEVSEIVQREMKDPRLGFVTVTDVEITPDLRHARVFVSVLGEEDKQNESLAALKSGEGFVRGELGKRLSMRMTPEVEFRLDTSIQRGAHIFELLEKIKKNEPPDE